MAPSPRPKADQQSQTPPKVPRSLEQPVDGVVPGFPVLFSGGALPELPGAPTLGMHNREILGTLLGLSDEQLKQLQLDGVV